MFKIGKMVVVYILGKKFVDSFKERDFFNVSKKLMNYIGMGFG